MFIGILQNVFQSRAVTFSQSCVYNELRVSFKPNNPNKVSVRGKPVPPGLCGVDKDNQLSTDEHAISPCKKAENADKMMGWIRYSYKEDNDVKLCWKGEIISKF